MTIKFNYRNIKGVQGSIKHQAAKVRIKNLKCLCNKIFVKFIMMKYTQDVKPSLIIYVTKELKRRKRENRRLASR